MNNKDTKRILVVDDEKMLLDITAQILEFKFPDYTIDTASSVEDAVALIGRFKYDLIMTDYGIRESTDDGGQHVCEAARSKDQKVPIILCTGSMTDIDAVDTVLRCCAEKYISKPFAMNDLIGTISELLRTHQSLATV